MTDQDIYKDCRHPKWAKETPARRLYVVACLIAILFVLIATPTWAQQVPSGVEADRLENSFDRVPSPRSEPAVSTDDAAEPAGPADKADEILFVLGGLTIDGATVYDPSELLPYYEEKLGQEVSFNDIYEIAGMITAHYRADGYFLSRAIVPPQRISGGIVRIQVIEGYVDSVSFEGGADTHIVYLNDYAASIMEARPLKMGVLERYLLLANDLPGVDARSVIRPSPSRPGASELVLVIEQEAFETSFSLDNFGSRFVGPYRARTSVSQFSNLWSGSESTLSYLTSAGSEGADWSELDFVDLVHTEHIGSEGIQITGRASLVRSEPGATLNDLEIQSRSVSAELSVSYPVIRSRSLSLSVEGGFGYRDSYTDLLGERLFEDKIRTVEAGFTADYADSLNGLTLIHAAVTKGLPILGHSENASNTLSRADASTDFLKFSGEAYRVQHLPEDFSMMLTAMGQVSNSSLVSGEEFGVGGSVIGRGYSPSEITGDHGVATAIELRWSPELDVPHLDSFQLFGFYDFGAVLNYGTDDMDTLASAGLGVRSRVLNNVDASILFGQPLTRNSDARTDDFLGLDGRWLFEINATY